MPAATSAERVCPEPAWQHVRWVVSTEQDAWHNMPMLLRHLQQVERAVPDHASLPLSIGYWWGPFLVFNRPTLSRALGNETFLNGCRHNLLRCISEPDNSCGIQGVAGLKQGALYNNDMLVKFCLDALPALRPFQALRHACREPDAKPSVDVLPPGEELPAEGTYNGTVERTSVGIMLHNDARLAPLDLWQELPV